MWVCIQVLSMLTDITLSDEFLHRCLHPCPGKQSFQALIRCFDARVAPNRTGMKRRDELGLQCRVCAQPNSTLETYETLMESITMLIRTDEREFSQTTLCVWVSDIGVDNLLQRCRLNLSACLNCHQMANSR